MKKEGRAPYARASTMLLAGLSLSVGWGIRGNFGHEYGAAFAGCLAVITTCLLSGREDWRRRVLYFAFFGMLGWGFGGSISYMQVISYTHSGHWPSQLHGFFGLFYIGFLWAAIGGAGAALPAVADRDRLTQFFRPLLFVFGAWVLLGALQEPLARALQDAASKALDPGEQRHESPLYWFDADYLPACAALTGLCIFDLFDRRSKNAVFLPLVGGLGALLGWAVQEVLISLDLAGRVGAALTYHLGDPNAIYEKTGQAFGTEVLLTNWPQWFHYFPQHIGWFIGLVMGIATYFALFGKFRSGASLFAYMACGWMLCFLALPVLGSIPFAELGGLRMTAPRSDDWAGITGVFIGMTLWMFRNQLPQVAFASVVSGFIGGAGFSGIAWLKLMLVAPGNAAKYDAMAKSGVINPTTAQAAIEQWAPWQQQNWHSFLEQSYGFVNGIAVAVALALLASRVREQDDTAPVRRWTEACAAFFVLIALTYVNLVKNVAAWAEQLSPSVWRRTITLPNGATRTVEALWDLPFVGRWPGLDWVELTPTGYFNITYALFATAFLVLAWRHLRRPLSVVPKTALGKGQMLYLILLWAMVIGNFERALPGWRPQRLLTEWIIFVNAVICTVMVLLCPREEDIVMISVPESFTPLYRRAWRIGLMSMVVAVLFFFSMTRAVYGDFHAGHAGKNLRWGPNADWRTRPNLKHEPHR